MTPQALPRAAAPRRSLLATTARATRALVALLAMAWAVPGCGGTDASDIRSKLPSYSCDPQLSGEAPTSPDVAADTGVAKVRYTIDPSAQTVQLALSGADDADLGTITIEHAFTIGAAFASTVETTYERGGVRRAHQKSQTQPMGGVVAQRTRTEVGGETAVMWATFKRNDQPPTSTRAFSLDQVTLGAPVAGGSPGAGKLVHTPDGDFQTLAAFHDGAKADTGAIEAFLAQSGLSKLSDDPDFQRMARVAQDAVWANQADLGARRCAASGTFDAEGALTPKASGARNKGSGGCANQGDPLEILGNEATVFTSIATGVTLTGILVAAGVISGGAAIIASVAVLGYASYVVLGKLEEGVQSVASHRLPGLRELQEIGGSGSSGCDKATGSSCRGSGSGTKSGSRGDPHIYSLDGTMYDAQVAGEYVLVESTAGEPFTVQVRQEPIRGICSSVAVNTALATRLGGATVEVRPDRWLLDGEPATLPANAVVFDNGDGISETDDGLTLRWQSGEVVRVRQGAHLDIGVELPDSRRGQVRGLLGTFDGDRDNELTSRDGTVSPPPVRWDLLVAFAQSYRIDQAESLFTYASGEDTSAFDVPGFPSGPTSVDQLPAATRDSARAECEGAGVDNPVSLERCIIDVGCTGESDFVDSHKDIDPDEAFAVQKPIDFSGWLPIGNGVWEIAPDRRSVLQTRNGDPTFFVSGVDYQDVMIEGTFTVETRSDDDYIGFAIGYNGPFEPTDGTKISGDNLRTLLLSWKGSTQGDAEEGFTLARVLGEVDPSGNGPLWSQVSTPSYQVLDTDYGEGRGWQSEQTYRFTLTYTKARMEVAIDGDVIFTLTAAEAGGDLPTGRFGFYNYSQSRVRYGDFTVVRLD
ncbi:MAG: VWD domain-containing protein [Myxococcales bacterium]|nr:VWD domain-containing protein [Myxococcales bacterium]